MSGITDFLKGVFDQVGQMGAWGPSVFVPLYAGATLFFVPTVFLTLTAGALFGIPVGFCVTVIAALATASAGFFLGRYLSRGWVAKKCQSDPRLHALDRAVAEKGWKAVLFLRLAAIFPFNLLNYGLGMTKIPFWTFLWASFLGTVPGVLLYVCIGAAAGEVALEGRKKTPLEWAFWGFGLAVTVTGVIWGAHIAKKAMGKYTEKVLP